MKRNKITYTILQKGSAVFMILTLLWLIVSVPFVYASQEEIAKHNKMTGAATPLDNCEEECDNPLTNTEEKAPNSLSSFSEEYLHENYFHHYFSSISSQDYRSENADVYIAFHGELIVPPPDAA